MDRKISVIIIDDENLARNIVRKFLSDIPDIEILSKCSNGFEALKAINDLKPDIIFLDIQMPKITGFEMLELLENPPVIIFTTAYDQYALKAFEVSAADYLLKPFSQERFSDALGKAKNAVINKQNNTQTINSLVRNIDDKSGYLERVVVKNGSKISIIPTDKIDRLEAEDDYVMIHTAESKHLKQKTMKYFEDHLDPNIFIRVHRSHIVKVSAIKQIELFEKDSYRVIFQDGRTSVPVSKTGYSKLKEVMG